MWPDFSQNVGRNIFRAYQVGQPKPLVTLRICGQSLLEVLVNYQPSPLIFLLSLIPTRPEGNNNFLWFTVPLTVYYSAELAVFGCMTDNLFPCFPSICQLQLQFICFTCKAYDMLRKDVMKSVRVPGVHLNWFINLPANRKISIRAPGRNLHWMLFRLFFFACSQLS